MPGERGGEEIGWTGEEGAKKQAGRTGEKKKRDGEEKQGESGKGAFPETVFANKGEKDQKWPEKRKAAKNAFRSGWNRNAPVFFLKTADGRILIPRGRT